MSFVFYSRRVAFSPNLSGEKSEQVISLGQFTCSSREIAPFPATLRQSRTLWDVWHRSVGGKKHYSRQRLETAATIQFYWRCMISTLCWIMCLFMMICQTLRTAEHEIYGLHTHCEIFSLRSFIWIDFCCFYFASHLVLCITASWAIFVRNLKALISTVRHLEWGYTCHVIPRLTLRRPPTASLPPPSVVLPQGLVSYNSFPLTLYTISVFLTQIKSRSQVSRQTF